MGVLPVEKLEPCRRCGHLLSPDAEPPCPQCKFKDPFGKDRDIRLGALVLTLALILYGWHQGWFDFSALWHGLSK